MTIASSEALALEDCVRVSELEIGQRVVAQTVHYDLPKGDQLPLSIAVFHHAPIEGVISYLPRNTDLPLGHPYRQDMVIMNRDGGIPPVILSPKPFAVAYEQLIGRHLFLVIEAA